MNNAILLNHAWAFNFRIIGGMGRYIGIQMDDFEEMAVTIARRNLNDYAPPLAR